LTEGEMIDDAQLREILDRVNVMDIRRINRDDFEAFVQELFTDIDDHAEDEE
jgi:hypothetical protein